MNGFEIGGRLKRALAVLVMAGPLFVTTPASADFAAGIAAYDSGDFVTAYGEWLPLARQGDLAAQRNIGHLYRRGRGVPQDFAVAANWYRRAAERGLTRAQANLADMYLRGQGVPQDMKKAATWFHRAATHGHVISQFDLGLMYQKGLGVEVDLGRAMGWFQLAAQAGHTQANQMLAALTAQGYSPAPLEVLQADPFAAAPAAVPPGNEEDTAALSEDGAGNDGEVQADRHRVEGGRRIARAIAEQTGPADTGGGAAEPVPAAAADSEPPQTNEAGPADDAPRQSGEEKSEVAVLADADEASEPAPAAAAEPAAQVAAIAEAESPEDAQTAAAGGQDEGVAAVPAPAQQQAAIIPDAEAQVEQGLLAYREQDFEAAFSLWLPVARAGNADAQFFVGGLYMDGSGVDEDFVRAHAWWRLSADQGQPKAKEFLQLIRSIMTPDQIAAAERLSPDLAAK